MTILKKFALIILMIFMLPVIVEGKSNIIVEIKPIATIEVSYGDNEFALPSSAVGITEDGEEVKLMLSWKSAMNDFGGELGQTYTLYPEIYGNSASMYNLKNGVRVSVKVKVLSGQVGEGSEINDITQVNNNEATYNDINFSVDNKIEIEMTIGNSNFHITENGVSKIIQMDTDIIYNENKSSMMFPARFISEALGYNVEFNADSELVVISKPSRKVVLQLWKATMLINGIGYQMVTPAINYNNRTYIPIRAVAESLDFNVSWDSSTQTATLRNY